MKHINIKHELEDCMSQYYKLKKLYMSLTKRWQIFDWHFLSGWVKGHRGDLEGLVPFGQLAPLLAGSSRNDW